MELYKDKTKSVSERVEDLLSRMTLEERELTLMAGMASDEIVFRKVVRLTGETHDVMGKRAYTCPVTIIEG